MDNFLSFRNQLIAGISEFAPQIDADTKDVEWLTDLVVTLSGYQEEGLNLFPVVFISRDLDLILETLHGRDPILVGTGETTTETVQKGFKHCAPLAEDRQWALFFEVKGDSLAYGLFRVEQSPVKPTAFERLRQLKDPNVKIIGLTRLPGNFVELRAANDRHLYIDLSGGGKNSYHGPRLIHDFTYIVARDTVDEVNTLLRAFYYQLGVDILHADHGSLVAVISANSDALSLVLSDGVFLDPIINISDGVDEYIETNHGGKSVQRLKAWRQLLRKMASMDGIVVLNTQGSIIGYNCFIAGSVLETNHGYPVGGARRRAFEVLASFLGNGIEGIMYRSQDGQAEFRSAKRKKQPGEAAF